MLRFNKSRLRLERLESRETPAISAVGPEFRLNTLTAGIQTAPAIALDADGDFVAAWSSAGEDGSGNGIVARRFNKDGTPLAAGFVVNSLTTGEQLQPAVATNSAGDFVVVWSAAAQDGDGFGVFGQRFDAAGNARGFEFQINQFTTGSQSSPAVAMDAAGGFVVAWNSLDQIGASFEIYARRYAADGTALGGEFRANSFTVDAQLSPAVGMNGLGSFVIAWTSNQQDSSGPGVYAQLYNRTGSTVGGEFRVNSFTTGSQTGVAAAMDAAGRFLIAWQSDDQVSPTSSNDVFGQRYFPDGTGFGGEFLINAVTTGNQIQVAVAADASGDFAVAFTTNESGTDNIAVRPGAVDGTLGSQLSVNTTTTSSQSLPALALSANGDFVVAWAGQGIGDVDGIHAQRYDQSVDDAGPHVTGISTPNHPDPVIEGEILTVAVPSFTAAFSEDMSVTGGSSGANSVTNKANWQLRFNGTNIAGSAISSISYGFNSATRRHEATFNLASPLGLGDYQLEPTAAIQDLAGNAIDGNFDGAPGGVFIRSFRVAALGLVGPEFRVNTVTTGNQSRPALAADASGNSVAVWQSDGQDGSGLGIYGQRYNTAGVPQGAEFRVNTFTTGNQSNCDVAMEPDGDFIVAWQSDGQDGAGDGIYAQRFNANGSPAGGEFQVNTTTLAHQDTPSVAIDADGDSVIVWSGNGVGDTSGVFGRRYDETGAALGAEFPVLAGTSGSGLTPVVAMDQEGDFIVAWFKYGQYGGAYGVQFRRFAASGVPLDAADESVSSGFGPPAIAVHADGSFIIASSTRAQRFSAAGVPTTGAIVVGQSGGDGRSAVAFDSSGIALMSWRDNSDVVFRRIDPLGNLLGTETRANTFTTGDQSFPAIAPQAQGGFLIAWQGEGQDGSANGVYAQRYGILGPPRVQSVQVNDGTAQRSRVTSLKITFDSIVTTISNPFALSRIGGGAVNFTTTANVVNGRTEVTLNNFTGSVTQFGSLIDGRYIFTVISQFVSNDAGNLDGDGDGIAGGNHTFGDAQGLYRYFGDRDGNRAVDNVDFFFFRPALGSSFPAPNYVAAFDFDGNGFITNTDFFQFRIRLGTSLP